MGTIRLQQMLRDDLVTIQKLTIMVTPCPSTSQFVDQVSELRETLYEAQAKILSFLDRLERTDVRAH